MTTEDETPKDAPVRASGQTPAAEEAHDVAQEVDRPLDMQIDVERSAEAQARTPAFLRIRLNWRDRGEMAVVQRIHSSLDHVMVREFVDAYRIIDEIQNTVRIQKEVDGVPLFDSATGLPVWETTPGGRFVEDYSRLGRKQIETLLFQISTRLFAWEQVAERMRTDALMAKAQFEEQFAISYEALRGSASRTTVEDRRAAGSTGAADERYFAIYLTGLSRRAEALVRSMNLLGQRLKDVLVAG